MRPRRVVVAFCVVLLVFAATRSGRSAESVDVRTYLELIRSVAEHGLPYFDNGPAERYVSLRSPFNLTAGGHLWGIYGPVYGYFGALPFLLGGLRLASIATCALLVPIALATFAVTRRLLRDDGDDADDEGETAEWYATAAAILVVVSTPVLGKSLELSGYPLAMLFAIASTAATLEAATSRTRARRLRFAAAAGVLYALGSGTHLLCLPTSLASLLALALVDLSDDDARGPAWLARTPFASLWPTRASLGAASVALATMIACTIPLAVLNKTRFGSYNPFSYGPQPWFGMEYLAAADQTIATHLRAAMPSIVFALVLFAVFLAAGVASESARARWAIRLGALVIGGAALALSTPLRDNVWLYAETAYAFVVDHSAFHLDGPYWRLPGTFGNLHGPWVTKATLQCTPALALALVLPRLAPQAKQKAVVVLAPSLALFVYLTLRGNLPFYSRLGVPWVYIRYTLPALPMLVAGAMLVAREMRARRREWILATLTGVAVAVGLFDDDRDNPIFRQILVLVGPLALALVTCALVVVARRSGRLSRVRDAAAIAIALTFGLGAGIGIGHDFRAHRDRKLYCDWRADVMRRAAPDRFALFGLHPTLDPLLAVTLERDVQYADMAEGDPRLSFWEKVHPVVEYWFTQDRPIFWAADNPTERPPWPDVEVELVDPPELIYRVRKKP